MSKIQNKKIVAKEYPLKDILSNNKYSIDYFQREYRWQKENIDQLIDDLYSAFRADYRPEHTTKDVANYASYFMGSIVVITKDDATMSIIDGQQRVTSLTLLLIYLYHAMNEKAAILQNMIFSDSYGEKSFNIQVPERKDCLDGLYNDNEYIPKDTDEDSVHCMADRYNDIKENFPEDLQGKMLESFMYWVINNIYIVKIEAYSEDNAYTIFETMNDRGLNLTNSDMLKGFILSKFQDDTKRTAINEQWKRDMHQLLSYGKDYDNAFFRVWMRSQFAETKRQSKAGSVDEDFEHIGVRFHSWFRDNYEKGRLKDAINGSMENFLDTNYRFFFNKYILIQEAQKDIIPGLEWIYYNQFRGISPYLAFPMMLAGLNLNDSDDECKRKMNLVAQFLDGFVVRRQINFRSYTASSIAYTMFNIIKSLRNKTYDEMVDVLRDRTEDLNIITGMNELRLHGQNGPFVKYFLCRITAYIEEQSGMGNNFKRYMTNPNCKPFEIEHIWSDHFDRHTEEFQHPEDFLRFRNKIGDLVLLPNGTNQSYNDMTEDDKIRHYVKENLLAGSLCPELYQKNPNFVNFINGHRLDFKTYEHFDKTSIEERCELYSKIASEIWTI
jgi:uncharacterized protein with ParB-like and HNH nuclease domain